MDRLKYPRLVLDSENFTDQAVSVSEQGLVFEGVDCGPLAEKYAPGADWDYEYWVTVGPGHVNWVLLELMRDRFAGSVALMDWLKLKGIPYDFQSY